MTREEAIQILSTRDAHGVLCGYISGVTEALDMAIEALKVKTNGDTISRADAIEAVVCHIWHMPNEAYKQFNCENIVREVVEDAIRRLPLAEAAQGEWIRVGHDIYECSLCHQNVMTKDIDCYSYCHRCGADMRQNYNKGEKK